MRTPSTRPFISPELGVSLGDDVCLSEEQRQAMAAIDKAASITKKGVGKGGHAHIRIATGGGKTFLAAKIKEHYIGDKTEIREIISIDLNSSEADLHKVFDSDGSFAGKMVMLDEAFFYDYYRHQEFFTGITDKDREVANKIATAGHAEEIAKSIAINRKKNELIKKIRRQGGMVVVFGASESPDRVQSEIDRKEDKIAKIEREIKELEARKRQILRQDRTLDEIHGLSETINRIVGAGNLRELDPMSLAETNWTRFLLKVCGAILNHQKALEKKASGDEKEKCRQRIKQLSEVRSTPYDSRFELIKRIILEAKYDDLIKTLTVQRDDARDVGEIEKKDDTEDVGEIEKKLEELKTDLPQRKRNLEERQAQHQALVARLNEKFDRIAEATIETKTQGSWSEGLIKDHFEAHKLTDTDKRVQYIVPDRDVEISDADAREILRVGAANFIFLPHTKTEGGLGYKIVSTNGEQFCADEDALKEFVASYIKPNTKLIMLYDRRNAVGGDYGLASTMVSRQVVHITKGLDGKGGGEPHVSRFTKQNLAQALGRDRTQDDAAKTPATYLIIHDGRKVLEAEAVQSEIDQNTKAEDKERGVAYLLYKITPTSGAREKRERYAKILWERYEVEVDPLTKEERDTDAIAAAEDILADSIRSAAAAAEERDRAATPIQKVFRVHRARVPLSAAALATAQRERAAAEAERERAKIEQAAASREAEAIASAAARIQAVARGRAARKVYADTREQAEKERTERERTAAAAAIREPEEKERASAAAAREQSKKEQATADMMAAEDILANRVKSDEARAASALATAQTETERTERRERAARERAAAEEAERERAERERATAEEAERERAERERAERERLERERTATASRETEAIASAAAARIQAVARGRAARIATAATREQAEKDHAERERAERERAATEERERTAAAAASREAEEKERATAAAASREAADAAKRAAEAKRVAEARRVAEAEEEARRVAEAERERASAAVAASKQAEEREREERAAAAAATSQQADAATTIQAAFRGHRVRKQQAKEKQAAIIIQTWMKHHRSQPASPGAPPSISSVSSPASDATPSHVSSASQQAERERAASVIGKAWRKRPSVSHEPKQKREEMVIFFDEMVDGEKSKMEGNPNKVEMELRKEWEGWHISPMVTTKKSQEEEKIVLKEDQNLWEKYEKDGKKGVKIDMTEWRKRIMDYYKDQGDKQKNEDAKKALFDENKKPSAVVQLISVIALRDEVRSRNSSR